MKWRASVGGQCIKACSNEWEQVSKMGKASNKKHPGRGAHGRLMKKTERGETGRDRTNAFRDDKRSGGVGAQAFRTYSRLFPIWSEA